MKPNTIAVKEAIKLAKLLIKQSEEYLKEVDEYRVFRKEYNPKMDFGDAEPPVSKKFAKLKRISHDLSESLVNLRKSPYNRS